MPACERVADVPDLDGDGVIKGDCEPGNPDVHPFAVELPNAIDDDCDGRVDEGTEAGDDDGDGLSEEQGDCDDANPGIHPGASEGEVGADGGLVGNGRDDDCDGVVDEGTDAFDDDGDGWTERDGDCRDSDATVHPGQAEACDDRDGDCDGEVDEGYDADGDGHRDAARCPGVAGVLDADDANPAVHPDATEACDGLDNDQDGDIDEDFDVDLDGWTTCAGDCLDSGPDGGDVHPGMQDEDGRESACDGLDSDCDGLIDDGFDQDGDGWTTCAGDTRDADATVHPGAVELCDAKDNDLDGLVDEDFDQDGDGAYDAGAAGCVAVHVTALLDCDDHDATVYPSATETCNGQDDDCDGDTDEGLRSTAWRDLDGDGFGDRAVSAELCSIPAGWTADDTDCDDSSAAIHPGAAETCNYIDDDCDGAEDEGVTATFYLDDDGDGFGDPDRSLEDCTAPTDYVADDTDCDDDDAAINPAATEVLNGIDDNCDSGEQVDEETGLLVAVDRFIEVVPNGSTTVQLPLPTAHDSNAVYDDWTVAILPDTVLDNGEWCEWFTSTPQLVPTGDYVEFDLTVGHCSAELPGETYGFRFHAALFVDVHSDVELDDDRIAWGSSGGGHSSSTTLSVSTSASGGDTLGICPMSYYEDGGDRDWGGLISCSLSGSSLSASASTNGCTADGYFFADPILIGGIPNLTVSSYSFSSVQHNQTHTSSSEITHTWGAGDHHLVLPVMQSVVTGCGDDLDIYATVTESPSGETWEFFHMQSGTYGYSGVLIALDGDFLYWADGTFFPE